MCTIGFLQNLDNSETEQLEFPDHELFLRYEGQVRDGKPWGIGNMTFKDGGFYSGEWTDALRNGEGIQEFSEDSEREHYTGSWKNDVEHGWGVLITKNGEKYEGSISNGIMQGKGTLTLKDGEKYEGEFWNNKRHGSGIENYSEDDPDKQVSYDGEWKENLKSGNGTMIWKGGNKYVGEWQNGDITGKGTYYWSDGQKYVGDYLNSKKHGHGIETYPENDPSGTVSYDGEWKEDERSGTGTMIWKDGNKYVGEWQDGYRSGKGTFYFSSGQKYVGDFLKSKFHGHGFETYPETDPSNIASYDGELMDGRKHGNGTIIWKNGDKYVGEWQNGERTGKGTYYFQSGQKYVGDFLKSKFHGHGFETYPETDPSNIASYVGELMDGRKHGNGTIIWKNGDKYVGEWQNGSRTGKGTYYFKSGQKYVGDFLNNKKNGHGLLTYPENDPNGQVSYDGEWKEDLKSGTGTFLWKSGDKYVGEYQDGLTNGKGTYYWPSGNKYVGDFLNGNFHGIGIKYSATNAVIQEGKWENDEFIGK